MLSLLGLRRDRRPPMPGRLQWVDELRLHVEERGPDEADAPPVVFLHGYLSSTDAWHGVMTRLPAGLRQVAVDLPGAGYSDRPADAPYTFPWFAEQVLGLLDALALPRAVFAGHSMGGSIALHLAARWPERVAGLALVSPLVYPQPAPPGLKIAKRHPEAMRLLFRSPVGRLAIPRMLAQASFANGKIDASDRARVLLGHLDAPGGWEVATTTGVRAAEHAPDEGLLGRVRAPSLILWGRHDRVYAPDEAERLGRDLAGPSRVVMLERSAHNGHEEEPGRAAEALAAFLDELARREP
jgi:pimeloyl-ACP methyl ester carboxylesterase